MATPTLHLSASSPPPTTSSATHPASHASALIEEAATMADTHGLRAYDAVQLASALVLHRHRVTLGLAPVVLVSADLELNAAAIAEGMTLDDPNQHP